VIVKDAFEEVVEILVGDTPKLMEDASDLDSAIGMGILSLPRCNEFPIPLLAKLPKAVSVVVRIAQNIPNVIGKFPEEFGSDSSVIRIRQRQYSGERDPDPSNGHGQVEFPPVHPAVPARFRPVGFGVNRRMRNDPGFLILLVPDAAFGSKRRTIASGGSTALPPRVQQKNQETTQTADLSGKRLRQSRQPSLKRPATGKATVFKQQRANDLHFERRLIEHGKEFVSGRNPFDDHDRQRFEKEPIRMGPGPHSGLCGRYFLTVSVIILRGAELEVS
jgi:hypothetical protein